MKSWKTVPIPAKMRELPKDNRGFPIPYVVMRDKNGTPHFTINDSRKAAACIKHDFCSICGSRLKDDLWVIGGPLSAFHPHGAYIDTPVHRDCGRYALQVCPYLAITKYTHRIDAKKLSQDNFDGVVFLDPTMIAERPAFFVLAKTKSITISDNGYIVPKRPFIQYELWNEGQELIGKEKIETLNNWKTENHLM